MNSRIVARAALCLFAIAASVQLPASVNGQSLADASAKPAPLRLFLRGGPKTHGPPENGFHDHPTWLKEWQPLLESRGAKVATSMKFPTAEELENTDVLVEFVQDGGSIMGDERESLEKFFKRGGGIVVIHDALVADRAADWFSTIVGGAWNGRTARYFEGENTYYFVNRDHPISKGAVNFTIDDEVYWNLIMQPGANILAATMEPPRRGRRGGPPPQQPAIGNLIPQIWVYENQLEGGKPYRAYVNLLGHNFSTFASPHARAILLRGIAWAGWRNVDSLTTPEEVAAMKQVDSPQP